MAALDFPASPSNGQTYTGPGGVVWTWDGSKWVTQGIGTAYLPLAGGTMTGPLQLIPGSVTAAALRFDITANTGLYGAAGSVSVATSGAARLTVNDTGVLSTVPITLPGAPTLPLNAATKAYVDGFLPLTGGQLNPGGLLIGPAGAVPSTGCLILNANTVAGPALNYTSNAWLVAGNGIACNLTLDSFAGASILVGRTSRGTAAAPTAVQLGDALLSLSGIGRRASAYSDSKGVVQIVASENWTDAAAGTAINFFTTVAGAGGAFVQSLQLSGNAAFFGGSITAPGAVSTGALSPASINTPGNTTTNSVTVGAGGISATGQIQSSNSGTGAIAATQGSLWAQLDVTAYRDLKCYGIPYAAQTTFSPISDPRVKTDIADYTAGLDVVTRLQPITFAYNGLADTPDDAASSTKRYGFDAQALQQVMPELVTSRDVPLHPDDEPTQLLMLGDLMPLFVSMVNSIKELATRVEQLEGAATP